MFGGESSHLPLKLNTSGVIPPIFASSLLLLPATLVGFAGNQADGAGGWVSWIATQLAHGQPLFMALYAGLIIFFCFFYTAIVFNPEETADNLQEVRRLHPRHPPGQVDRRLSRLRADPDHGDRRRLSDGGLPAAGVPDVAILRCRSTSAAPAC